MIAAIGIVAEQRIREALNRGDLDNLPGEGRPLALDDDASIPEELRMAYRLLKNGGYLDEAAPNANSPAPTALSDMLRANPDERATMRRMLKLQILEARMKSREGHTLTLSPSYHDTVVERIPLASQPE